jgi:GH24 family phage-related lysozyme (muramidase)
MSEASIRKNWTAKLQTRLELADKANRSVRWWSQRAGSAHGLDMLRAAVARRTLRRKQVAEARKVLARHPGDPTGISAEGLAFIAGREGFRGAVYRDQVGVLTQGYGETQGIQPGRVWTREHALKRLKERVNENYLAPVLKLLKALGHHPEQHEVDALASLVYNLGPGILEQGHTMGDAIRSGDRMRIANAFLVYDFAGGRKLLGLTLRRRAERKMYLG